MALWLKKDALGAQCCARIVPGYFSAVFDRPQPNRCAVVSVCNVTDDSRLAVQLLQYRQEKNAASDGEHAVENVSPCLAPQLPESVNTDCKVDDADRYQQCGEQCFRNEEVVVEVAYIQECGNAQP